MSVAHTIINYKKGVKGKEENKGYAELRLQVVKRFGGVGGRARPKGESGWLSRAANIICLSNILVIQ